MSNQVAQPTAAVAPTTNVQYFLCITCNQHKPATDYNFKKSDGSRYPTCRVCNQANNVTFWQDKQFKFCDKCRAFKPIRKFYTYNGAPSMYCIKCHCADLTFKKLTEDADKTYNNGNITAQYAWGPAVGTNIRPQAAMFSKTVGSGKR